MKEAVLIKQSHNSEEPLHEQAIPDISIAVINTNNRDMVLDCLRSVVATAGEMALEVIVVNNGCTDGSRDAIQAEFPQIMLIDNPEKLGFSTNNNLALKRAKGRYLLLLNDDTIVKPGALQTLVAFMDFHPEVGAVGAELLNPDGSFQACYDRIPNPLMDGFLPFSKIIFPLTRSNGRPLPVGYVCGACMLVRSSVADQVGFLDTRFDPLYSEEVDWCFRIKNAGWEVYHVPDAKVIHIGGATMNRMPIHRYQQIFQKKAVFFRKHYGEASVILYKIALFLTSFIKMVGWFVRSLFPNSAEAKDKARLQWTMLHKIWKF